MKTKTHRRNENSRLGFIEGVHAVLDYATVNKPSFFESLICICHNTPLPDPFHENMLLGKFINMFIQMKTEYQSNK